MPRLGLRRRALPNIIMVFNAGNVENSDYENTNQATGITELRVLE
jgi:hypothetical protein